MQPSETVGPYKVFYKEAGITFCYAVEDILVDAITEASCLAQAGISDQSIYIKDSEGNEW